MKSFIQMNMEEIVLLKWQIIQNKSNIYGLNVHEPSCKWDTLFPVSPAAPLFLPSPSPSPWLGKGEFFTTTEFKYNSLGVTKLF